MKKQVKLKIYLQIYHKIFQSLYIILKLDEDKGKIKLMLRRIAEFPDPGWDCMNKNIATLTHFICE